MGTITPSEAIVETLRAEGVTMIAGIVGSAYMDMLDLLPAADIRFVSVRHEQTAAHIADGFARVSGRPGVCIGQNGPGITNMVTSVAAAYHAHTPMIVITPSATTGSVGLDGFQEIEQLSIFRSITKAQFRVPRPDRVAETFRAAFRAATSELGPVQVDIPRDYFYGESDEAILAPSRYRATTRRPPATADVQRAARLLAEARRPIILSGFGVVESDAQASVARLAEALVAPVANTYLHNDSFPSRHPLAVGPIGYMGSKAAMKLLSESDVVLMLGSRINVFSTVPQYGLDFFPASASIIQVDIDARQIGRSRPVAMGITADARLTAEALLDAIGQIRGSDDVEAAARASAVEEQRAAWERELEDLSTSDSQPIHPRRALRDLAQAMPEDAIVATDIGNVCSTANAYLRFEEPRQFLAAMTFGNCGYAYPAALGAQLAAPDRPVVAFVGDGAWGMSLHETMTAVEEGLPVVAAVFNNGQWGAEKRNQIDFYGSRFVATDIGRTIGGFNFCAIAQAMGAVGVRVEKPDEVGPALRDSLSSRRPTVLEIMVDAAELAEPFRRDALRKPMRRLERYAHLT